IGPNSPDEIARKLTRLEELERENARLREAEAKLQREFDNVNAALKLPNAEFAQARSKVAGKPDGLAHPNNLDRSKKQPQQHTGAEPASEGEGAAEKGNGQ